ncbi:MAG: hypothetical protein AVDCRST_MAG89-3955, partial [uncultured Gemmatimonadetes bacterium]
CSLFSGAAGCSSSSQASCTSSACSSSRWKRAARPGSAPA